MPDCFISYSSADEAFARALHDDLSANGVSVFTAAVSLQPGQVWTDAIFENLRTSSWVIFLASRQACESPYVQQEIGRAMAASKNLVPVVWNMAPDELPGWVNRIQALDIRDLTVGEIRARVFQIADRIKADKRKGTLILAGLVGVLLILGKD